MSRIFPIVILAALATGCQDARDALKVFHDGKTKIKYKQGPFGTLFELENDKDVTVVVKGFRLNPVTKEIEFDLIEIVDSASTRLDAMGRLAPAWGQYVMAPVTTYRHTMNQDARDLMVEAREMIETLGRIWQPYILAKAGSIEKDAARGPLSHHIANMLIRQIMPKDMLGQMVTGDPDLAGAIAAEIAAAKQSINAVDPSVLPLPAFLKPISQAPANPIDAQTLTDIGKPKPATNLPPRRAVNAGDLTPAELPPLPSRDDVRREFALSEVVQAGLPEMELVRFK